MTARVDPPLVGGWLAGRSIARGVPLPVAELGGWRVDTASYAERRRYVFPEACDGLRHLAETLREPRIPLKLCDTREAMRALLPPRWTIGAPCHLMTGDRTLATRVTLPDGYRADVSRRTDARGTVSTVLIEAPDGTPAASGYAATRDGFRVFDRIVTHEAHRRRGLGRATMALLADDCDDPDRDALPVLVATEAGRALYETLGWTARSPYTTAVIEGA